MSENIAQVIEVASDGNRYIQYDWYPKAIPENLEMEDMVYLDSTYSFAAFQSTQPGGFKLGYASGNYLHSHFVVGEKGKITIGKYVILEATNIFVNDSVTIGDHCMFSWGSYITDSWLDESSYPSAIRKLILKNLSTSAIRHLNIPKPKPVIIEDNVWVGFDAVILPGVRLGRGCVVGCKTVISSDVPPYAVVVGDPARIVKYLEANDTVEEKEKAIKKYIR